MEQKKINSGVHYYSEALKTQLQGILTAPVSLIEAPSGYGKTMAVTDTLAAVERDAACEVIWLTATDEALELYWKRFCMTVQQIDAAAAAHLNRIGFPSWVSSTEAAQVIKNINTEKETYLVIDNYHFAAKIPSTITTALLTHKYPSVHIVLITEHADKNLIAAAMHVRACIIRTDDLTMSARDIAAFAGESGREIGMQQARELYALSGGWAAAVRMLLLRYLETGRIGEFAETRELIDRVIWSRIGKTGREFLMCTSLFESFSLEQAWYMMGQVGGADDAIEFLRQSPFLAEGQDGRLSVHPLLHRFAKTVFLDRDPAWQKSMLSRAGSWCVSAGETAQAIGFFYLSQDYASLLKLDLMCLSLEEVNGVSYDTIACEIAKNCSRKTKSENLIAFLRLSDILFSAGSTDAYQALIDELDDIVRTELADDGSLRGEWMLHAVWRDFPDVTLMAARCREAQKLLPGVSVSVKPSDPFLFQCPSLWYLLHMQAGRADATADVLDELVPLYAGMTGGHGTGANVLYRAEIAASRGQLETAEILTYKAAFLAEHAGQIGIRYGAALTFGRIAVTKADQTGFGQAMDYLDKTYADAMATQNTAVNRYTVEVVRGMLLSMMNDTKSCAGWLLDGDLARGAFAPVRGMAAYVYLDDMILNKEYARAIGYMENMSAPLDPKGYIAERTYILLGTFLCYLGLNNIKKAAEHLRLALDAAAADGMFSAFSRFLPLIEPLMTLPGMKDYRAVVGRIKALNLKYLVGETGSIEIDVPDTLRVKKTVSDELTAREREVARFAAQGMYNKEIGLRLNVSENTVRAHLRSVFQKLGISRRSELIRCMQDADAEG